MKSKNYENLLIFFWILILISLNSHFAATHNLYNENFFSKVNFFTFFNFIRFYIPFFLLPILIFIFIINKKKKSNLIIPLFLAYFTWQAFAFFASNRKLETYEIYPDIINTITSAYSVYEEQKYNSLNLVLNSLSLLIIILIANNLNLQKAIRKFFKVSLIFIGLILAYFIIKLFFETIDQKYFYWSKTLGAETSTFGQPSPRITGLARLIFINYLFFFIILLNNLKKTIYYIILILLGILIYKSQARGAIIGIVLVFFLFFVFHSCNIKKKLSILFILLIFPIFTFETYHYYKYNINIKSEKNIKPEINIETINRLIKVHHTSGRTTIWRDTINIIKEKNIFLGFGPQSDRFLLNQKRILKNESNQGFFDNNTSNLFLYAYLCGGITGLFLILIIFLLSLNSIYKNIFKYKILFRKNDIFISFSIILLSYLLIRSIFENSFSLFSIDFIFFILAYLTSVNSKKLSR